MTIEQTASRRKPQQRGGDGGPPPVLAPENAAPPRVFREVDVEAMTTSALNASHRDPDGELVASVRERGVLQPPLVRPIPPTTVTEHGSVRITTRAGRFELVYGERRWKAAKLNGHATIPCEVRELTDEEAAELRGAENDKRKDLSPLQEAHQFNVFRAHFGRGVAHIAKRMNRSERHVVQRLALLELPSIARFALDSGKLLLGAALLIAALPAADRDAATTMVLPVHVDGPPRSVTEARDLIVERFHRRMGMAGWGLSDAALVPAAGACSSCPKRTSAQGALFDELVDKDDRCIDLGCWASKETAWWRGVESTAAAAGVRVLDAKEGGKAAAAEAKLFVATAEKKHRLINLDAPCDVLGDARVQAAQKALVDAEGAATPDPARIEAAAAALKQREAEADTVTWGDVLHDAVRPVAIVRETTPGGRDRILQFVPERAALIALQDTGVDLPASVAERLAEPEPEPGETALPKWKVEERTYEIAHARLVAALVPAAEKDEPTVEFWRMCVGAAGRLSLSQDVVARRGWTPFPGETTGDTIQRAIAGLTEAELRGLFVELLFDTSPEAREGFARLFGVNLRKVTSAAAKQARIELLAEPKKKAGKAARGEGST